MLDLSLPSPAWQVKQKLLQISYRLSLVAIGSDYLYRFGGNYRDSGGLYTKRSDKYDILTDQWTELVNQETAEAVSNQSRK